MMFKGLMAAGLSFVLFTGISACDASNSLNEDVSKIETSSEPTASPVTEKQVLKQPVNTPLIEQYSQSELEHIYQVLNEYEGCIGSLIPQHVEEACQSIGGTMQPQGMSGCFSCTHNYSDGGQVCTDGSECQGDCRGWIDMDKAEGGDFVGECAYDDSIFGCYTVIEEGKQVSGGCID